MIEIRIPLSKTDVLFEIVDTNNDPIFVCINYLILHGKRFIYEAKLENRTIFVLDFLIQLKNHMELDKYILSTDTDANPDKFINKYGLLYHALR